MKTKKRFSCILLIFILFTSCLAEPDIELPEHIRGLDNLTVYSEIPTSLPLLELVQEMSFGDTDEVLIGRIGTIATDDSGRVYISDVQEQTIHVFGPGGTYLTNIGRQGNGPGEFQTVGGLQISSNRLYANDFIQRRMNVYLLEDFSFSHTISLIPSNMDEIEELTGLRAGIYYPRQDGTILTGFRSNANTDAESRLLFYVMGEDGHIVPDKILDQKDRYFLNDPGSDMMSLFGFTPAPMQALSADGRIFSASSEDFLIKVHSPDGTYRRSFYYPFEKKEIVREELLEEYPNETHQQILRNADLPVTWPALDSSKNMKIDDDNNIWVATVDENEEADDWWMLNEQGELQGILRINSDRYLHEIKDGRVYLRETDDDTGQQRIIRYRITIPSPGAGE